MHKTKSTTKNLKLFKDWTNIRLNYFGVVIGLLGYFTALTPSLMPRPAYFIGIVGGVGFALGYGVGALISSLVRKYPSFSEPQKNIKHYAWLVLWIMLPLFIAASSFLTRYWQNQQRTLLDLPLIENVGILTVIASAILTATLLFIVSFGVHWLYRIVRGWIHKIPLPLPYIGGIAAAVIVAVILFESLTGILHRTVVVALRNSYQSTNSYINPDLTQPQSPLRSGSSTSLADWTKLGAQGRRFVATGPSQRAIKEFTHKPAKEPIRIYAGINNASTREERIRLVLKEMERTHAFDRKMVTVATPTGTGWIEGESIAALEYMQNGDVATVTAQYSYLPSGLSFLLDRGEATAMGRDLFNAVEKKIHSLPKDKRPKLVSYGLSLGSFGGQSGFSGEQDFARRLDGALFVGTPGFSQPWRTLTATRDEGSPEIKPVYNHENVIKFATSTDDIINDTNKSYKVVYYQYATDPFVWFNAALAYREPDWMKEAPGRGVSPSLHWTPIVTFLQIAIDQIYSLTIEGDNGHDYSHDTAAAFAAATKPNDWSAAKSKELQKLINSYDFSNRMKN